MGSSRLPGKVLMRLGNSVVLDYVVSRCKKVENVCDVIVATSALKQDDPIEEWCRKNKLTCFRGSESDVLSRYYKCAKKLNVDNVMRVTADCPFVDYDFAGEIIQEMEEKTVDFIKVNGHLARGLTVELFSFKSLEYIYLNGMEERHKEHVTYYAYEYSDEFNYHIYNAPKYMCHPELRMTLDTEEDYELCKYIADYFPNDKLVSTEKVVNYLLAHPEIAQLNAHVQQKPVK